MGLIETLVNVFVQIIAVFLTIGIFAFVAITILDPFIRKAIEIIKKWKEANK